jgi:hypothetical protein
MGNRALTHRPNYRWSILVLLLAKALAGDVEGAREVIPQLNQLIPDVRMSSLKVLLNPYRPEGVEKVIEGLRLAGLPERPSTTALPPSCQPTSQATPG